MLPATTKNEAIRLRVNERRSLDEIHAATKISVGTLSRLLRQYPLTQDEVDARRKGPPKKDRGVRSKFFEMVGKEELSRSRKGQIAEAAVLFRLAVRGYKVFSSPFDGEKTDWLVLSPTTGKYARIEVRWAQQPAHGLPLVSLMIHDGRSNRRRYRKDELDFLVAYDFFSDTAYVFNIDELGNKERVSIREDAAERWDKI